MRQTAAVTGGIPLTVAVDVCIRCGKCEGQCPQHLPIRDLLVKVAETFAE